MQKGEQMHILDMIIINATDSVAVSVINWQAIDVVGSATLCVTPKIYREN